MDFRNKIMFSETTIKNKQIKDISQKLTILKGKCSLLVKRDSIEKEKEIKKNISKNWI